MTYLVANFKMNPERQEDMEAWIEKFQASFEGKPAEGMRVVLCPPFIWLPLMAARISQHISRTPSPAPSSRGSLLKLGTSLRENTKYQIPNTVSLGAQDVFWETKGAYTGEVSPSMLRGIGCEYVIVGHSERRVLGETNEIVNRKIKAALQAGLKVILAVGEPARTDEDGTLEREVGPALEEQLVEALPGISRAKLGNLIVAYEPLWAVGSGIADTPEDALKAALFIRKCVRKATGTRRAQELPVLYGGSVTSKNAASFLAEEALNGILVGGASLDAREFSKIVAMSASRSC